MHTRRLHARSERLHPRFLARQPAVRMFQAKRKGEGLAKRHLDHMRLMQGRQDLAAQIA